MSFKENCSKLLKQAKNVPKVFKDITSDFLDDLEVVYREAGTVEGFRARAQQLQADKILEIKSLRNEAIGAVFRAERNRNVLSKGIEQRVQARVGNTTDAAKIRDITKEAAREALKATISDTTDVTFGGKYSFEVRKKSFLSSMISVVKKLDRIETNESKMIFFKKSARDIFEDGTKDKQIFMEMFELSQGRSGGISNDPLALKIAKVLHEDFNPTELKIKQQAGISVGKNKLYITGLDYSKDIIKNLGKTRSESKEIFVNIMKDNIDLEESFTTSRSIDNSLRYMFDAILDGRNFDMFDELDPAVKETFNPAVVNKGRLSNRFNKPRKIVFKDGESMYKIFDKMTEGNLAKNVYSRMMRTAKSAAMIDTFGPNPELGYANLKKFLAKQYDLDESDLTGGVLDRADDIFETARGILPEEGFASKSTNGFIAWQVFKRLGVAVISAANDYPMAIATIRSRTGMGYVEAMSSLFEEFKTTFKSKAQQREYADYLEILMENEMGHMYNMFADAAGGSPNRIIKYADWVLSATGFHRQIFSARHSVAAVASRFTAKAAREGFENVDPNLRLHLEGYGFNSKTINLLKAGIEKIQGPNSVKEMVTPRAIRNGLKQLGDLKGFKEEFGFKGTDDKFIEEVVSRYKSFLGDVAEIGSPNTTIRDRAAMKFGVKSDSQMLNAVRVMTLFKSFPFAMSRKVSHIAKGNPASMNKTFAQAIGPNGGGFKSLAELTAGMTGMAILTQLAKDALRGETIDIEKMSEDPMLGAKFIGGALLNSGVLGLYGSGMSAILRDGVKEGGVKFVGGPAVSELQDIDRYLSKVGRELGAAAEGEQGFGEAATKSFSKTLDLGFRQIPNVWFGGSALKKELNAINQRNLDPEMHQRTQTNFERYREEGGRTSILELLGD